MRRRPGLALATQRTGHAPGDAQRPARRGPRRAGRVTLATLALVAIALIVPGPAAAHKPPVHQEMAREALAMYRQLYAGAHGGLEPELAEGAFWDELLEGAEDEDALNNDHVYGFLMPFLGHFWDADAGPDSRYHDPTLEEDYPNAWQKARRLWSMALGSYAQGRKSEAYGYLGHVAHLLGDMSVPAHVHLDEHGVSGDDAFEDWMAGHHALSKADRAALEAGPITIPADVTDKLYWLLYTTNQVADHFASDDVDGDDVDPYGWAGPELAALAGVGPVQAASLADNDTWEWFDQDNDADGDLSTIRRYAYVRGIRAIASLFDLFEESVARRQTATVVINRVAEAGWPRVHDTVTGPDYYARVSLDSDGPGFGGMVGRNRGDYTGDATVITPNWAFGTVLRPDQLHTVLPVTIEIWDWDQTLVWELDEWSEVFSGDDDQSDVTNRSGRTLDLTVDVDKCLASEPNAVYGTGNDAGIRFLANTDHRCGVYTMLDTGDSIPAASRLSFTILMSSPSDPPATTTVVTSSASLSPLGAAVTWTAAVDPADGSGTVAFAADGDLIAGCGAQPLALSNGRYEATCVASSLPIGSHAVTATYGGHPGAYRPSTGTLPGEQIVVPAWTAGPASFADPVDHPLGGQNWPVAVAVGDLDGLNGADIVTVNPGPNTASVLKATGDGGYVQTDYQTGTAADPETDPWAVAIGNVYGGAPQDVVTANPQRDSVSVLENTGTGFVLRGPYAVGSGPASVAVGDLDGSGRLDIVTANIWSTTVTVLRASGSPFVRNEYEVGATPGSVAIGDLDGSGRLDIVTANPSNDTVSVLLARPAPATGYYPAMQYPVGEIPGEPRTVAIGDLNGDGRSDIVAATAQGVTVLVASGGGYDRTDYAGDPREPGATSVAIGDLNFDGRPDLVTGNYKTISVWLANPGGGYARIDVDMPDDNRAVAVGELDSSPGLDLVTANNHLLTVSVLQNTTPVKALTSTSVGVCTPPEDPAAGMDVSWTCPATNPEDYYPTELGQPIALTASVSPTDGTGTVLFAADGVPISTCLEQPLAPVDGTHRATCRTYGFPVGAHDITATYSGTAVYGPNTGVLTGGLSVEKATLSVNALFAEKGYGQPDPAFAWSYAGFVFGDTVDTAGITGAANCTRTTGEIVAGSSYSLTGGPYSISCSPGSLSAPNYRFEVGSPAEFVINQAPLAIDAVQASKVYGDADPPFAWSYRGFAAGEDETNVTILGSPVCSRVPGETVDGGPYAITCDPGTLAAANYSFVAGDPADLTIIERPSLTVDAVAASKAYGDPDPPFAWTLSGFLPGDEPGSVEISGSPVCARVAGESVGDSPYTITCEPGTLAAANYRFVTGAQATFTIGTADTSLSVAPKSSTYSEQAVDVTFTATVSNTSTSVSVNEGTVTFTIRTGTTVLASGTSATAAAGAASMQLTLPAGTGVGAYSIEAAYNPGGNFDGSSGSSTLTLNPRDTTTGTSAASATFGDASVTLSATVAAASSPVPGSTVNQGTVTFTLKKGTVVIGTATTSGTVANGDASATYVIPTGTPAGSYSIEAVYNGTVNLGGSSAAAKTFTIGANPTAVTVTTDPNPVQYSDAAVLTATVTPDTAGGEDPTGSVEFKVNGTSVGSGSIDSSGVATLTTAVSLPAGTYPVTAIFTSTNSNFAGSSTRATYNLDVVQEDAAVEYTGDTLGLKGAGLTLQATVWDSAATGFTGDNEEAGPAATIGTITEMYVVFDIYSGTCTGEPMASAAAQVVDTGAVGDGVGTATATVTFTSASEDPYCARTRVSSGDGSTNLFYAVLPQSTVITFYDDVGQFVTGSGRVTDPAGSRGSFGFNARYSKNGQPQGRFVYAWRGMYGGVAADFTIRSNALSALSFTGTAYPLSATLQGKANFQIIRVSDGVELYGSGNGTFVATAYDSGQGLGRGMDTFSLTFTEKGSKVPTKSFSAAPLKGGSIVIHLK